MSEWSGASAASHMERSQRGSHDGVPQPPQLPQPAQGGLLGQACSRLEHEQSLGNSLLRSIDAQWLAEHSDLWEAFISNPHDPAVLGQIPPAGDAMDICQPAASGDLPTSHLGSSAHDSAAQRDISSAPARLPVTTGFRAGSPVSPVLETPRAPAQAKPAQSARTTRSARTEALAPARSSGTLDRRAGVLVPEVSLAARAGSLGATSLTGSQRAASGGLRGAAPALPAGLRRGSESADSDGGVGPPPPPQAGPKPPERRGPGRKKRTQPMFVETEDGEQKWVSPEEFRKLRRRITNRLSARRMRKKHAEERQVINATTSTLEEERDAYAQECASLQQQLAQLAQRHRALEQAHAQLQAQCGLGLAQPLQHAAGFASHALAPPPVPLDLQPLSLDPPFPGPGGEAEAGFQSANLHLAMPAIPLSGAPGELAPPPLGSLQPGQPLMRRQSARIHAGRPLLE